MMKLGLGLLFAEGLANRFGISSPASNIFTIWMKALSQTLGALVFVVRSNFQNTKFIEVRYIVDCSEIFPKSLLI